MYTTVFNKLNNVINNQQVIPRKELSFNLYIMGTRTQQMMMISSTRKTRNVAGSNQPKDPLVDISRYKLVHTRYHSIIIWYTPDMQLKIERQDALAVKKRV